MRKHVQGEAAGGSHAAKQREGISTDGNPRDAQRGTPDWQQPQRVQAGWEGAPSCQCALANLHLLVGLDELP